MALRTIDPLCLNGDTCTLPGPSWRQRLWLETWAATRMVVQFMALAAVWSLVRYRVFALYVTFSHVGAVVWGEIFSLVTG